ncbi:tryptophan 2,3-dioxygenase family protein [Nonomuraea sp. NPDC049725]|uniref:tryptophan 2,3-dioxygenase family protein n=1 Tax=Nonomuraea sp. NPDC049725 TaxID=3154508 RepID=UPI0034473A04
MTARVTYSGYLRLEELLGLQNGLSEGHPDELHFIVTHQAMELWFKIMINDVRRARAHLEDGAWTKAAAVLKRLNNVTGNGIAQISTLADMGPAAFNGFRDVLGSASGLESAQFRVVEVLAGLRTPEYLHSIRALNRGSLPPVVGAALKEPGLAEAAELAGKKSGVEDWAKVYREPEDYGPIAVMAELLTDFDVLWFRWRAEHIVLVERMIGRRFTGTGGKSAGYLARTLQYRFFPFLWEARNTLYETGMK